MLINFSCESCGKRFQVDERSHGKRGRCMQCGHVMRIPRVEDAEHSHIRAAAATSAAIATPNAIITPDAAAIHAAASEADPPFRLSPPSPAPMLHREIVYPATLPAAQQPEPPRRADPHPSVFLLASPAAGTEQPRGDEAHARFELLDDDADPAAIVPVSPAVQRGLQEIAEFQKDRRGYKIVGEQGGRFSLSWLRTSGPANWFYVQWRAGVGLVLKLLRWVDAWAYLISVPFIILMIFGIVVENPGFVHTGAVVVVLANYGRFWADLLAFFVRPYKDGPLQGLAFLFPPYTIIYLATHWDRMKPILRRIAGSCIPIVLVVLAYAFVPLVNPASKDVEGMEAKIESGKQELDKEVNDEVKKFEKRLIELGEPVKTAPVPKR